MKKTELLSRMEAVSAEMSMFLDSTPLLIAVSEFRKIADKFEDLINIVEDEGIEDD
jgi:hypothetical protein